MPAPDTQAEGRRVAKADRKAATSARALAALDAWLEDQDRTVHA
jgi:hypothetical protein